MASYSSESRKIEKNQLTLKNNNNNAKITSGTGGCHNDRLHF